MRLNFLEVCARFSCMTLYLCKAWSHKFTRIWVSIWPLICDTQVLWQQIGHFMGVIPGISEDRGLRFLKYEDWRYNTLKYEEVKTKNIKLIMIEDEETCNMLFNSNYFRACLNKLCTENFSVRTLWTVLRMRKDGFVLGSVRIPNLKFEDCEDTFRW